MMTGEQYLKQVGDLVLQIESLARKYISERGTYQAGDHIRDEIGEAVVRHATIKICPLNEVPKVKYQCDNLTSEGKVSVKNPVREILSDKVIKKVNKRK